LTRRTKQSGRLDADAFGQIFDDHHDEIYRFIYYRVSNVQQAQDLTGEVFTRLIEQAGQNKLENRNIRAWLYQVARNLVIDEMRAKKHRQNQELPQVLPSDEPSIPSKVQNQILAEQAREALNNLPDKQNTAVALRYLEGLSTREIASIMGIRRGTVRVLIHRGLKALRQIMLLLDAQSPK
jgi:RNA polymerase sigma-70 factor (ECF subfamily)